MNQDEDLPPLPAAKPDLRSRPSRARYNKVKGALDLKWRRREPQVERMMREVIDALWDTFGDSPWSWCGLWLQQPDGAAFHAGPARPAASQAPAPAAVGEALAAGESKSGPGVSGGMIAVPILDKNGKAWAVFEARSSAEFDGMDARWLEQLFKPFQATARPEHLPPS